MRPDAVPALSDGPAASVDPGPGPPAALGDLMERARRALAGRLSGPTDTALAADGPSGADGRGASHGLAVVLEVDEATGRPVIRVCDARTGRPVREVSPAALMRLSGRG